MIKGKNHFIAGGLLLGLTLVFSACQSPLDFKTSDEQNVVELSDENNIMQENDLRVLGTVVGTGHPGNNSGLVFAPVGEATWNTGTWVRGITWVSAPTTTYPLQTLRFGVYSSKATKIVLEIYSEYNASTKLAVSYATGSNARYDYNMVKGSDSVWRAAVKLPKNALYAFRVWGPNWNYSTTWKRGNSTAGYVSDVDSAGNRFNPNKVLYDPYALEMSHDKETPAMYAAGHDGGMYGTGAALYKGVARRTYDTAMWAPKGVAVYDTTSTGTKPKIDQKDAIIYEAHVRGLTNHSSTASLSTILASVPVFKPSSTVGSTAGTTYTNAFSGQANISSAYRGTYKGAGLMAPYLKALGINTIELLPVHETANDINSSTGPGGNFWGYMTYGYFAPDRRYSYNKAYGGPTKEFKEMVKAFHAAGIEVYLDVVYNHSGEGGTWGDANTTELTSFRGFDNSAYYALVSTNKASYWESTGCGNNLNTGHPNTSLMVKDSLKYWITKMGVDGFRFDLAPVLGRDAAPYYNYNPNAQLNKDIAAMSTTYNVEMIAEAWDIGTYAVGTFPSKWGVWNGRYRDSTRGFFKGDLSTGNGITYADAFNGDYNFFNDQGGPQKSVNFIVAHDGFTLTDLVSYNSKQNNGLSWPFGVSDGGSDSNLSWDSNGNQALRRQRVRSLLTWQVFSRGIPMLVYGDEMGRTQNGNNNPYNIDSVATWNNYSMVNRDAPNTAPTGTSGSAYHNNLGTDGKADGKNNIFIFTANLLNRRKGETSLRQGNYTMPIYFAKANGAGGFNATADRAVRIHMDGSAVGGNDYLLFVNNWSGDVAFTAPNADNGKRWIRVIDTAQWAEANNNVWADNTAWTLTGTYTAKAWSIVVFKCVN